MKLPKVQRLDIEKNKYVIIKEKEYNKIEKFIKQYLEDLEDSKLIKEAIATSEKNYTLDEVAKDCGVDLKKLRAKRKLKK